jgi:hypothetical protein
LGPFGAHSRLFETVKRIKFRAERVCERRHRFGSVGVEAVADVRYSDLPSSSHCKVLGYRENLHGRRARKVIQGVFFAIWLGFDSDFTGVSLGWHPTRVKSE